MAADKARKSQLFKRDSHTSQRRCGRIQRFRRMRKVGSVEGLRLLYSRAQEAIPGTEHIYESLAKFSQAHQIKQHLNIAP